MIKLLLPILFPSWRFFSSIGPSPRIDLAFMAQENDEPLEWSAYNLLPEKLSIRSYITRLFYNPEWNLQLYLNTCAEHLIAIEQLGESNIVFYEQEITRQIIVAISKRRIEAPANKNQVKFRIRTLEYTSDHASDAAKEKVQEKIVFVSQVIPFKNKSEA